MSHRIWSRMIACILVVAALAASGAQAAPSAWQTTNAPAAPSDVRINLSSSSQLQLTWRDNSSDETGFRLWDGSRQTLAPANATSQTFSDLSAGQRYCFTVQSYRGVTGSAWTSWVCATTPQPGSSWQQAYQRYVGDVGMACPSDNMRPDPRGARGFICQCTSYVNFRLLQAGVSADHVTGNGNAGDWHRRAASGRLTTGSTPRVGAVLEFGNGNGSYERGEHVMFVEQVQGSSVLVSEYNWERVGDYGSRWIDPASDAWARQLTWRYLYFSNLGGTTPTPTPNPSVTVTVDAPGRGFTAYTRPGASGSWFSAGGLGQGGSMLFTSTNGSAWSRFGNWEPTLTSEGSYLVEVYIPRQYATARAKYVIVHRGGVTARVVDQSRYFDQWVDLGVYTFGTRGALVQLANDTGEAPGARWVGFDAMRWTRR